MVLKVYFILDGENQVLENINLITKDFYDDNKELIETLTKSTNSIMDNAEKFVKIISGDLKTLINVLCSIELYFFIKKYLINQYRL